MSEREREREREWGASARARAFVCVHNLPVLMCECMCKVGGET